MHRFRTTEVKAWSEIWHGLPKSGLIPARRDLLPETIPHLLPSIMVLDLADPDIIRFRLAGTAIVDRYGFNPTGRNFLDLVDDANRNQVGLVLRLAARHPFGIHSTVLSKFGHGLQIEVEALAFPFHAGDGESVQMVSVSQPVRDTAELDSRPHSLRRVEAAQFDFIDLGAGIPEGLAQA